MSRNGMVLVVLGTFLAAMLGSVLPVLLLGNQQGVASVAGSAESSRHLDVNASGVVYATPDQATVQIGVNAQAKTAAEALKQNSADASAVIEQVKALGVAAEDIQTSDFAVFPTYDDTGMNITGYQVSNTVVVKIRDLSSAGSLLDAVVQAGANNINGLTFGISDPTELQATAREQAIAAARAKAEQMASAAGVRLGEVISMSESVGYSAPSYAKEAMMAADTMSVPLESGQQQISVDVYVSFAIR